MKRYIKLFEDWKDSDSVLNLQNLQTFLEYNTWVPLTEQEIEASEDPDAVHDGESAIRQYLSSDPKQVVALDTQWRHDTIDMGKNLDTTSDWMYMGNFPELFYQEGESDSHLSLNGFPLERAGTVRDEFIMGAKKLSEESDYPTFIFRWRGHTVVLCRSLQDVQEWLFMKKEDFIEEVIG